MSTLTAITAINGLMSLAINALIASQKYQIAIERARAEGRDVTEEELQDIQRQNQALTDSTIARLQGNGE